MFNLSESLVQQRSSARAGCQAIIARTASQSKVQAQDMDRATIRLAMSCGALIAIARLDCLPSVRGRELMMKGS